MPCAQVDGKPLVESLAIMRYLASTQPIEDHWYPKDPYSRAKVDEYLEWQHNNTRLNCVMYFQTKWLIPSMTQSSPNEKRVQSFKGKMETNLQEIENIWLDGGKKNFIAGDELSVADIWACCELEQPSMAGYDVREGRPIIDQYMARVKEGLNPHYDDLHKMVYHFIKKFGGKIPGVDIEMPSKL